MLATLTPAERTLRARLAAHTLHAKRDPSETSAAGRAAFLKSFELKADPEGRLPEAERLRRADHLLKAHMAAMALRASKARRRRAKAEREVGALDEGPDTDSPAVVTPATGKQNEASHGE
jgi:hypothetical protein